MLFDLQISQVVFIPQAQPHAQSLFLFPIVFGIMFQALSSFWFWRGNTGPGSSFSAPSDPFQNNFLHIHRVIVVVDLITKISCRMYKTMYVLLPPSLFSNSSSTADSRIHTYRYVVADTRKIPLKNNPDDRYCTRYLSRGKQSPKKK